MLKVNNLSKSYGSNTVLNGVNLEFERRKIKSFLGPNGAGKTTTFNIVSGVETPSAGTIHLNGKDITNLPVHLRAARGISYLTQENSLFRGLSVEKNIQVYLDGIDYKEENPARDASRFMERLNISNLRGREVNNLSTGQKRKVEIARALALSPDYLLLDEPFSDLDPRSVAEIKEVLVSLKEEEEIGIVLSDHRAKEALSIADYNYLLDEGNIIAEGDSREIVQSETAKKSYFVKK